MKFLADNHKAPPTGLWFGGETPGQTQVSRGGTLQSGSQTNVRSESPLSAHRGSTQSPVWTRISSRETPRHVVSFVWIDPGSVAVGKSSFLDESHQGLSSFSPPSRRRTARVALTPARIATSAVGFCAQGVSVAITKSQVICGFYDVLGPAGRRKKHRLSSCRPSESEEEKGQVGGNCTKARLAANPESRRDCKLGLRPLSPLRSTWSAWATEAETPLCRKPRIHQRRLRRSLASSLLQETASTTSAAAAAAPAQAAHAPPPAAATTTTTAATTTAASTSLCCWCCYYCCNSKLNFTSATTSKLSFASTCCFTSTKISTACITSTTISTATAAPAPLHHFRWHSCLADHVYAA